MAWQVETLNGLVDEEIAALPSEIQAAFLQLSQRSKS